MKSLFTPQDWLENFHMSQYTFIYLCDKLQSSIKKDTKMRRIVPNDVHVAFMLWLLATSADYHITGHLFGISQSTID